jgi:hypothetical protein
MLSVAPHFNFKNGKKRRRKRRVCKDLSVVLKMIHKPVEIAQRVVPYAPCYSSVKFIVHC